jgi:HlyD family secretion protein
MTARGRTRTAAAAVIVVAMAAAVVAVFAAVARRPGSGAGGGGGGGDREWAEVHRQDLVIAVPVSGTLAAVDAAYLSPPTTQEVFELKITFLAPEGSAVRRGQRVMAFDTSELEKRLVDLQAERDAAQQHEERLAADLARSRHADERELAQAAADERLARLKLAVPPELKSRFELADARGDLDLAVAKVAYYRERLRLGTAAERAQLAVLAATRADAVRRVAEAQAAIAATRVAAPRDGTLIYVPDRLGVKKKVGDTCFRAEPVLEIPDLSRLQADGEIDEADLGTVAPGQGVTLRLDAHPDVSFAGTVQSLRPVVQARSPRDPQKVVKVAIALAHTDPLVMRPGMRFVGAVEVARARSVLVAPLAAVVARPDGAWVYRRSSFGVEAVRPRLGRRDDTWVEVLSGLAAGDRLRRFGDAGTAPAGGGTVPVAGGGGAAAARRGAA